MGRHSRRGPADNGDTADIPVPPELRSPPQAGPGSGRRRRSAAPDGATQTAPRTPSRPSGPSVRGGHPEQQEPGGGWGTSGTRGEPRTQPRTAAGSPTVPHPRSGRPRQEYVEAFDAFDAFDAEDTVNAMGSVGVSRRGSYDSVTDREADTDGAPETDASGAGAGGEDGERTESDGGREKRGKGLTFAGIAAAAVTTVLAVVVAGQVADGHGGSSGGLSAKSADGSRVHDDSASRSDDRATPSRTAQAAPATYDQKMAKKYPLKADLKASGKFAAVGGFDKAPGRGQKFRYRVDVEKGLGLDGTLFAQAVQKTLNDKRSWAHEGARTFERISSGKPDFVITLASPGTTADWCAKSGLDTTEDNVSCDSAATDRVMINAYRWAQGSKTYDDVLHGSAIHPYRQMLINHEVGHRLGYNHVTCSQDGALAPVMQQQTKFLTFDGITCKPNPWVYPNA
ncbi:MULTISPECIES: DUF3152 domain-containing protein [unclassified Streptomyces]|uniref:DUF3152 domain-containing protein n=1 Tax=unclassified Streptomyces TaxID=2593676 RepID=UPI0015EB5CA6|nr:DUF3152 domain-containing protein [Streptomyces sp. PsTaAH-137]